MLRLPDLRRVPELRSSARTLYLFDARADEWWICTWDGAEVRLSVDDLTEFLTHCLASAKPPDEHS